MKYKNVVVAGGGVLGSQIAFQCAYCGFNVTVLVPNEDSVKSFNKKIDNLKKTYIKTIKVMNTKAGKAPGLWANGIADIKHHNLNKCMNKVKNIMDFISIETNQAEALRDADLVIESITEIFDVKKDFYESIAPLMPAKTVIVTNSSTLLPSKDAAIALLYFLIVASALFFFTSLESNSAVVFIILLYPLKNVLKVFSLTFLSLDSIYVGQLLSFNSTDFPFSSIILSNFKSTSVSLE